MVWNTMILSQYVIVRAIIHRPVPQGVRPAMIQHYRSTSTDHGCWGLHPESGPSLYCTVLAYLALRLLGVPPEDPLAARAATWIRACSGGVRAVPSWGKFWLAVAGLSDYRAMAPIPPEAFLMPGRSPVHPDRLYCHTRSVYQAMAYLYGARFQGDLGELAGPLRQELYGGRPAHRADRGLLHRPDVYVPPNLALRIAQQALALYEVRPSRRLRARALDQCVRRVEHEQRVTSQIGLSPVSSLLNILVLYANRAEPDTVDHALAAMDYWRWLDPERGLRFAGARSHTWDTSFAIEALLAAGDPSDAALDAADRACAFLRQAQVTDEIEEPEITARSPAAGCWCFSEGGHRWPVSDCTAEALAALLHAERPGRTPTLQAQRLQEAVSFLLQRQNPDGGFGTYEARRASVLLEAMNPSEMFSHCMVEGSYVECTGSALVALSRAVGYLPTPLRERARRAIDDGTRFLLRTQLKEGAWPAAWGVNRIYGTFFAIRGLRAAGVPVTDPRLMAAARWLASVQRDDGGWGEHHRGCLEDRYIPYPSAQPVMTAWALLALMEITGPSDAAVERGIGWLRDHQLDDGSWTQQAVTGVFFGTAMLRYELYSAYFPLWALGRWLRLRQAG